MTDERGDPWLTTAQAAERLGVSVATVARYVRLGLLPALRLPSGRYRVRRSEVERLLREGQEAEY